RASGQCRLFGTFKEIDLEGNIFADNVKIKIDFTGTSYTATDSVRLRPGRIKLDNITIRDTEGHTALLNGEVGHTFFKEPTFKFDITNARNFLSYNVTPRDNPDWYGTIYGNGGASVSGYPGVVNINVDMATAPRSSFTFVLNDRLDAEDYSFLTFRDITPDSLRAQTEVIDDTPEAVLAFKKKAAAGADTPSEYNMDIRVDITKDAAMTLVMDPVGGDEIKAHGDGNLHLAYRSANNDLNIWGKYTLADGSYRFTLQDIIIKDFTIKEGSMIQFDGDPYGVKTNLEAFYATNANLSDLDESFLQDKEVARTNVPVHALMKVTGDIRQPAIDFDLEFPTLTQDTYRKVRSIVSTSDMMNRQIIYLLALNRFYTPDYVASTTKGSELFSVASSTISSQLGNILGKLSDKWSIAPNFRSDRGDFSDVEVDVALSSRLLNNRLIFNGNFGYRDKALNSNQFIGDFDIEYLLNKRGTWRLKAYNRYNDRNYYVRTAQTTQGVGIMFRRDFDSFLSFLRRKHKPTKEQKETDDNK
ncbi:MAG: translocation/assembly module TamB, partial [Muribaculaceae bacterium]|nr:translocation/assembly module TamB [Muribaculaceae bacterium]